MAGGGGEQEGQELNLIPYLDVMVNLVLFMLMNITSFLAFTVLNASIPQLSADPEQARQELAQKASMLLMLRVKEDGFTLDPNIQGGKSLPRIEVPKISKQFDFVSLRDQSKKLKAQFPEETRVLIMAEPKVKYDDIVKTMDAVRDRETDGDQKLFPDITLSAL